MASRVRSSPPELPGYDYVRSIGGGGFADVFLYRQQRPARHVAIKVLRAEHLGPAAIAQFDHEADVMAEVSTHPYIVTVYSSGVAPDGRPFIVLEHYPQPHFATRAQGGGMSVAEVLRTSVQISSAVHHAHQSQILHRDIKPSNILTSEFGKPGLTDFGISGVIADGGVSAASGVTIQFAPPEALRDPDVPTEVAGDVYSLAATAYALLSGRPPFWVVGGSNTAQDLISRTISQRVPATGRTDTGPLEHLLANALSADPADRPASALALARSLQDIEQQLHLPMTQIETREEFTETTPLDRDSDDGTRLAPKVVDPDGAPRTPPAAPMAPVVTSGLAPVSHPVSGAATTPTQADGTAGPGALAASTVVRDGATPEAEPSPFGSRPEPAPASVAEEHGPPTRLLLGAGGTVVLLVLALVFFLTRDSEATQAGGRDEPRSSTTRPPLAVYEVPLPEDITATWDASTKRYTVTWTEVDVPDGTSVIYRVRPIDPVSMETSVDTDLLEAFEPGWSVSGGSLLIEALDLAGAPPPCIDLMTVAETRAPSDISPPVCP